MRGVNPRRPRARRSSRRAGQSLTELSLVAPLLVVLVIAAAQFGVIIFGAISLDTAARDGSRVAAQQPFGSGAYSNGNPPTGLNSAQLAAIPGCAPVGASSNPVCDSVCAASGGRPSSLPAPSCVGAGLPLSVTAITPSCATGTLTPTGCTPTTQPACSASSPNGIRDGYVNVSVSYQAPVFVPVLGALLSDPGQNYRTLTVTVTTRVEPCTITLGT